MGKKNNVLVGYFHNARRFADIYNGYYYAGRQVIDPALLEDASEKYDGALVRSAAKDVRSKAAERIRDIKKLYRGRTLRIIGLEDLNSVDYTVGVRNMEYDALEYARQLEEIRVQHELKGDYTTAAERLCGFCRGDKLMAVNTLWLYHGTEIYDGPRSLRDMLDLGEDMAPHEAADYPVNILCVDEKLDTGAFHTEVKQLFKVLQKRGDKDALRELFEQDESYRSLDADTVEAISVAIDRPGIWKKRHQYMSEDEGGNVNMCKAMDDWEAEAKSEGRKQGAELKCIEQTMKKLAKGKTPEEIADALEEEVSVIERICSAIDACRPECNMEKILAAVNQ